VVAARGRSLQRNIFRRSYPPYDKQRQEKENEIHNEIFFDLIALVAVLALVAGPAAAQQKKPNIVFIMGDDIGMWNIVAYHRGMMAGRTPNLDKLAKEGMLFTDYYAEASCTRVAPTSSPANCPSARA